MTAVTIAPDRPRTRPLRAVAATAVVVLVLALVNIADHVLGWSSL